MDNSTGQERQRFWRRINNPQRYRRGVGLAIGIAIGCAIGGVMGNIGVGVAIGVGIGAALEGSFAERQRRRRQ